MLTLLIAATPAQGRSAPATSRTARTTVRAPRSVVHSDTLRRSIESSDVAGAAEILFWSTRPSLTCDWLLCTALGLILGGTLGNLYDRLVFNGVRDFLHWYYAFEWPVFNVADCCLVVGAGLLLTQAVFHRPEQSSEVTRPVAAEAATPGAV